MHWAELQFDQFRACSESDNGPSKIGAVAHWLAAEFVALEGWRELGLCDIRISRLLIAYPDHSDLLRRCRNAVYHFQKTPLDPRIAQVLSNKNEELRWAAALHFELQGVLLRLADRLRSGSVDQQEAAAILAKSMGWFPKHPFQDEVDRFSAACAEYEDLLLSANAQAAEAKKLYIATLRKELAELDTYPLSSALSRLQLTDSANDA